jgi:hypothetical protein
MALCDVSIMFFEVKDTNSVLSLHLLRQEMIPLYPKRRSNPIIEFSLWMICNNLQFEPRVRKN